MYMAPYQSTEGGSVNVRHSLHNWYNVCSVLWALWMALTIWCTDFTLQVHNCKKIQIAALTFDSHDTSGLPLIRPRFSLVTNCFAIYHLYTLQLHNCTKLFCNCVRMYYYCGRAFDTFSLPIYVHVHTDVQVYYVNVLSHMPYIHFCYSMSSIEGIMWDFPHRQTLPYLSSYNTLPSLCAARSLHTAQLVSVEQWGGH